MKQKEEISKKIISHNIILFISYNILYGFILALVAILVKFMLQNFHNVIFSVCLAIVYGIITYNIIHFSCRSCSIETFKKFKLNDQGEKSFLSEMNLIFILSILLSIFISVGSLMNFNISYKNQINTAINEYSSVSEEFANNLTLQIKNQHDIEKKELTYSTVTYELFLVVSFLSLIPYQEKLVKKFNK